MHRCIKTQIWEKATAGKMKAKSTTLRNIAPVLIHYFLVWHILAHYPMFLFRSPSCELYMVLEATTDLSVCKTEIITTRHLGSPATQMMLNNRKVTRLGIEPRPSGKIPDALTTELSGLTGTICYVLFMHPLLQLGILVI